MRIKKPPKRINLGEAYTIASSSNDIDYFKYQAPVDDKGRYLHWDELRHRIKSGLNEQVVWTLVKQARISNIKYFAFRDINGTLSSLYITSVIQRICSQIDRLTSSAAENELMRGFAGSSYLSRDLEWEESISSSQLEGAATTSRVAKEMLQINRPARNESEKMILGNVRMMRYAIEHAEDHLTPALLKELHSEGVSGIDDEVYMPGQFRNDNNVVVEDTSTGETIHQPPDYQIIENLINRLCKWANHPHETDVTSQYLHPLIKACVLHFMIGYIHPFSDGNGRTARAIFYWYMMKCGYTAFRHISISRLLKNAPTAYGKSYLYTETDDFDLTYFVTFQFEKISQAVTDYIDHIKQAQKIKAEIEQWLWGSNFSKQINDKQRQIMVIAVSNPGRLFTAKEVSENLGISDNTARTYLKELEKLGLMRRHKDGKGNVYSSAKNLEQLQLWAGQVSMPKTTNW